MTLPFIAKIAIAGWNEGSLKWRAIPREQTQLTQSTRYIETSTGLLNADCDIVPVMLFLTDHRAETIERVVAAVKDVARAQSGAGRGVQAGGRQCRRHGGDERGSGGEGVSDPRRRVRRGDRDVPASRSARVLGTVLVVVPLALVSVLVYAVMALVGHRTQGLDAADGRARRGHRRRLRHLSLQPHAGVSRSRASACARPTSARCASPAPASSSPASRSPSAS